MLLRLFCVSLIGALGLGSAQTSAPDPHKLVLVGDRFPALKYDDMTPEQKTMIDHLLAGPRHGANGPFNVLLRSPESGDLIQQFGAYERFQLGFPKDVAEVVILATARYNLNQFEWNGHKTGAVKAGVKAAVVKAIAEGKRPAGLSPDEETAYNFVDEIQTTHQVTDATFNAVKDKWGEKGVVDLIGLIGYYGWISMAINTDRLPLGPGVKPELKPLQNPLPVVGMGFATTVPGTPSPTAARSTVNGRTLNLRGDRFPALKYDEMTPDQKKLVDTTFAGRGPGGSINIQLRNPETGLIMYAIGDQVRAQHKGLSEKLNEMAIMITSRYYTTPMEWNTHSRNAVKAGLSEDAAKAIGEGRVPTGLAPDEQAVYSYLREWFNTRQISDATFKALKDAVGERGIVDVMVSSGYYQLISMFMNADRLPQGNQPPPLAYIARPLP